MNEFENNAIFWIETEKIRPNPYQPRKEFDEHHLRDLADSIRMYGVLQPLVVTRLETQKEDGNIEVEYELIAGERRLRASKLAGVTKVPAIIRMGAENSRVKLELAIIENLQREDLNPVDRAMAFARLANEFNLKHTEIASKVGKSREYVSNTLRLLSLPQDILDALRSGKLSEGHARTLMMLTDRREEQNTLFKEILWKKLTVREAEQIARHIAKERVRKKALITPEIEDIEVKLAETLGTRVHIEPRQVGGGRLMIDYFSPEDLELIWLRLNSQGEGRKFTPVVVPDPDLHTSNSETEVPPESVPTQTPIPPSADDAKTEDRISQEQPIDDRPKEEQQRSMDEIDEDLYSVKSFTL
jgi:ParB family chromosome partitioning protein